MGKPLASTAPAERAELHREKMVEKARNRAARYQAHQRNRPPAPRANLSQHHPDGWCSVAEHTKRKAGRLV
jgi:hypothetical protein